MDALAVLTRDPSRAAILLDIDGVLAPIVPRPEDARVPDDTRDVLRALAAKYAVVACITGRLEDDATDVVGVDGIVYIGNHGLDLDPAADQWRDRLRLFLEEVGWPRTENKGVTAGLHYRGVADERAARAELEDVAVRAREAGFVTRFGRKVLEVLPPLNVNKGTAIRALLADRGLRHALYAGDDTTDIDAFDALDGLDAAVRVAVASNEGPPELRERADIVVSSPEELRELLLQL